MLRDTVLKLLISPMVVMRMFVILFVLCLLVIQCGCHWSQLKASYLLI